MPMPPRHRGSSAGQSVLVMQTFEHRIVSVPSTHSALAQSFSPVQVIPAAAVPRGPGMQYTCCGSSAWQRVPSGQSSLLKHGHAFGVVHSAGASIAIGAASIGGDTPSLQAASAAKPRQIRSTAHDTAPCSDILGNGLAMGMTFNETYLIPKTVQPALHGAKLAALVSDLIARTVVAKPYALVVGEDVALPFRLSSPLASVVLERRKAPRGTRVAYRGDDPEALVAAVAAHRDGNALVYFADVPPLLEDIPNERSIPVLVYALATVQGFDLHLPKIDKNWNEIPGTAWTKHRARTAAVVLGTGLDQGHHKPVRKIRNVLQKHLGALDERASILH